MTNGYRARREDECSNVDKDILVKDTSRIVRRTVGYFNGEMSYYHFEPTDVTKPSAPLARIWTEEISVRHVTYGPRRTIVSDEELCALSCTEDLANSISASTNKALEY